MSDKDENKAVKGLKYWFSTPSPSSDHEDDVWHHEDLLNGDWYLIMNSTEWYESPNVPQIYADHKYIFQQNMEMNRPEERYYKQDVDSGGFRSIMECGEDLPSGRGELKLTTNIKTKSPPSGENDFAMVDYSVELEARYDFPNGITFLPRLVARPLNKMFRYLFLKHIGDEMIEYDIEYARERLIEYYQYIRKYHGEEPIQSKSRRSSYTPPSERPFFQ